MLKTKITLVEGLSGLLGFILKSKLEFDQPRMNLFAKFGSLANSPLSNISWSLGALYANLGVQIQR